MQRGGAGRKEHDVRLLLVCTLRLNMPDVAKVSAGLGLCELPIYTMCCV